MKSKLKLSQDMSYSERELSIGGFVYSGYAFKSKDLTTFGIPVVKIGNINNRIISLEKTEYFPENLVSNKLTKFFLKNNDVLIAMTGQGSVGRVGKIRLKEGQKVLLNQRVGKFITDEVNLNLEYLYQVISSKKYENILFNTGTGSGQPNLSPELIQSIKIPLPDIKIQKKIANILATIDELIWHHNHINNVLEQIIQSIFKSWFVDFDGQTEFVESELGKIPKGWSVSELKDTLSLIKDGSHNPPKRVESGIRFIAGASDVKHFIIDFSKCSYITQNDYEEIHKRWQIQPNDVLLTIVGTIGNVAIVRDEDLPFSLQRSLAVLRPNENINFIFLYCLLNSLEFEQFLYSNLNPTGQPGIYLGTLGGFKFVLPPNHIIKKFFNMSQKIIAIIQKNYSNIDYLTKIRDSLLPKLMSGEIRV